MGFVGLKVALHTAETLEAAYPERFAISEAFRAIGESGVNGIYDWSKGRVPFDEIAAAVVVEPGAEKLSDEEIRTKAIEAVAYEAHIMLEEAVVADARDIDTGLLLGAGWPFFMGGLCKYLDQTGTSERLFGRKLITDKDGAFA
jgi:3-hydroxyacyl-CoA dehydrogenase